MARENLSYGIPRFGELFPHLFIRDKPNRISTKTILIPMILLIFRIFLLFTICNSLISLLPLNTQKGMQPIASLAASFSLFSTTVGSMCRR